MGDSVVLFERADLVSAADWFAVNHHALDGSLVDALECAGTIADERVRYLVTSCLCEKHQLWSRHYADRVMEYARDRFAI